MINFVFFCCSTSYYYLSNLMGWNNVEIKILQKFLLYTVIHMIKLTFYHIVQILLKLKQYYCKCKGACFFLNSFQWMVWYNLNCKKTECTLALASSWSWAALTFSFLPCHALRTEACRARPKEKVRAQGLGPVVVLMAFRLRVESSSDCPPDKNVMPKKYI